MPIYDLFSERQRKLANQGVPVIYQYDYLPGTFRNQVVHIWHGALGAEINHKRDVQREHWLAMWQYIEHTIARELGMTNLGHSGSFPWTQCEDFLHKAPTEQALDIIELSFKIVDTKLREPQSPEFMGVRATQSPDDAIDELNHRFRAHSIGFKFAGGQIIKVDSEYLHSQVVEETLVLLHEQGFEGPQVEFMRAHSHYRTGVYQDAIVNAENAFESTMKSICDARNWAYPPTATAKPLIDIVVAKGLIPPYSPDHLEHVIGSLKTGLPTVRNKTGGHGQGKTAVLVPEYIAAYALHLAATNIVLLVQAHKALP
jgi:hypothetical protein